MDKPTFKPSTPHEGLGRITLPPIPEQRQPTTKPHLWQRLTRWIAAHKKASALIAVGAVLVLAGGGTMLYLMLQPKPKPAVHTSIAKVQAPPAPQAPVFYSPLTGVTVANEAATKQEVTGIMIENSDDARPQSGLKDAGVVFEAIAEGGITRFAVLYQEAKPQLIGPVRSVRLYYLDWMAAFDPSIVHVGGSAQALAEVRGGSFKDADQFFNGSYFWRATDRYAPHNVYTSFDKLDALNQAKGYTSSTFTGFPRKADAPPTHPNATSIDIGISSADFNVHYDFSQGCDCYLRSEGGEPHKDRESGQQLSPKVVIAIKVPTTTVLEDGYREQMGTTGSGTSYVFQDGTVSAGTWSKADQKSQIIFKDAQGKPISLNRGQTWITATPTYEDVSWR